ncbi:MAG: hypothetical protein KAU14_01255 [Thermoplasmata archaeon]|nr:hypothetical protein [Thermoplasmata archaeon]
MIGGAELLGYVFLLSFGIFALVIGAITAKFGSGVSRTIGIVTALIGLIALGGYVAIQEEALEVFYFSIVAGIGALIGVLLGLGIFLISIMKS